MGGCVVLTIINLRHSPDWGTLIYWIVTFTSILSLREGEEEKMDMILSKILLGVLN